MELPQNILNMLLQSVATYRNYVLGHQGKKSNEEADEVNEFSLD